MHPSDNHMLRKLRPLAPDGEHQGSAQTSGAEDGGDPASSGEPPGARRQMRPGSRVARWCLREPTRAHPAHLCCHLEDRVVDRRGASWLRAVLERERSAEQEAAERAALRGAWELASVLEFLEVFHAQLGLPRRCSAADLEAALVLSPGGPGVLADVHLARPQHSFLRYCVSVLEGVRA